MSVATYARFLARWAGIAAAGAALLAGASHLQAQKSDRAGSQAFLIETVGATVGSAAGFGIAVALASPDDCGEDLGCTLRKLGLALLVSAGGAATGDLVVGSMVGTRPSAPGAVVGSLAGIAAGVGVVHLLSEELDLTRSDAALFISYSLTQGIVTALGSRIGAWLRD